MTEIDTTYSWPTREGDTVVLHQRADTLAGGPPPPPVAPAPPPPDPAPDRRIGAGMLLALAVIVLALAGAAIAYFLAHRGTSTQVTTVVVRSTAPEPATKPVVAGSNVAVPALTGKSLTDARAALVALGLAANATQVTSSQPVGTIVDQAPKPGSRLAKGSAVTLAVAKQAVAKTTTAATAPTTTATTPPQPQSVTMPDVGGRTEASGVQALSRAGILASLFFIPGSDPLGTVEGQAKSAGTTLPYHAHAQINLSSGPGDKAKEQVPNVVGRSLQDALRAINGAHLRLIYVKLPVSSRSQAGKVVQQSPLGGGHAPQNAQVLVFLGALRG